MAQKRTRVLVAVDTSAPAHHALHYAIGRLLDPRDHELVLVSAYIPPNYSRYSRDKDPTAASSLATDTEQHSECDALLPPRWASRLRAFAHEAYLGGFSTAAPCAVTVAAGSDVGCGRFREMLLVAAVYFQVDAVVIGCRQMGSLGRLLSGSTSQFFIRSRVGDVVLVRPSMTPHAGVSNDPLTTMLVTADPPLEDSHAQPSPPSNTSAWTRAADAVVLDPALATVSSLEDRENALISVIVEQPDVLIVKTSACGRQTRPPSTAAAAAAAAAPEPVHPLVFHDPAQDPHNLRDSSFNSSMFDLTTLRLESDLLWMDTHGGDRLLRVVVRSSPSSEAHGTPEWSSPSVVDVLLPGESPALKSWRKTIINHIADIAPVEAVIITSV